MNNNRRSWFRKGILFFFFFVGVILLLGLALMQLWNAILVPAVHVSAINYGQALGIFILSKILFGGFRGGWGSRRGYSMHAIQQKFTSMTPEEREKFKAEWKNRCTGWGVKDPSENAS